MMMMIDDLRAWRVDTPAGMELRGDAAVAYKNYRPPTCSLRWSKEGRELQDQAYHEHIAYMTILTALKTECLTE